MDGLDWIYLRPLLPLEHRGANKCNKDILAHLARHKQTNANKQTQTIKTIKQTDVGAPGQAEINK